MKRNFFVNWMFTFLKTIPSALVVSAVFVLLGCVSYYFGGGKILSYRAGSVEGNILSAAAMFFVLFYIGIISVCASGMSVPGVRMFPEFGRKTLQAAVTAALFAVPAFLLFMLIDPFVIKPGIPLFIEILTFFILRCSFIYYSLFICCITEELNPLFGIPVFFKTVLRSFIKLVLFVAVMYIVRIGTSKLIIACSDATANFSVYKAFSSEVVLGGFFIISGLAIFLIYLFMISFAANIYYNYKSEEK
ncbi:hypothetical protein Dip518_001132 [Parelusimicrobium proximum]|uniref:hypothetical protein n=1 Tax=Parelusimicrobium proximum TaxID=3228953 RepID=UPI003D1670EB